MNKKIIKSTMKQSVYFLADGNCSEAMQFYHFVFGGELNLTRVSESPAKDRMPGEFQNKIINARLKSDIVDISASDWLMPHQQRIAGNHLCMYLTASNINELKTYFDKLAAGASITDPLEEKFFGTYGALNDKYGNRWMFVVEK